MSSSCRARTQADPLGQDCLWYVVLLVTDDIAFLTIGALSEAFRQKTLSPVDVAKVVSRRIHALDPAINAFVHHLDEEHFQALARESESRWMKGHPIGPLDGIPVTVKDTLPAIGWASRRGSLTTDSSVDDTEDAPAVASVRDAGAILLGKTTTPEFGWKTVTDSPLSGITRNPWNLELTPGGSSGGSAAALAAGIGFASIGTDAAGSVRIPAAFTSLVGFKATVGRVPRYPPSALGSLGHVGVLARDIIDTALMASVISRDDARDWQALGAGTDDYASGLDRGVTNLRIGFCPNPGSVRIEEDVAARVSQAVSALSDLGAVVDVVDSPYNGAEEVYATLFAAGQSYALRKLSTVSRELLDPGLLQMLARLGTPSLTEFQAAEEKRASIGRQSRKLHERFELLCTPTVPIAPFPVLRISPEGWENWNWMTWASFTYPINLTGQPAVTIPCGFTGTGLPVGLQIIGPLGGDALVLGAANALRQLRIGDPDRKPDMRGIQAVPSNAR